MLEQLHTLLDAMLGDKTILIWGAGREGLSTYHFLRRHFPHKPLTLADAKQPNLTDLTHLTYLPSGDWCDEFATFDLIFKSPGIPLLDPRIIRDKLTSQTALFLHFFREQTVGISGTKGKSTTASLLFHVLSQTGRDAVLLGNIGIPALNHFDDMARSPDKIAVLELSCHQLETLTVSPHRAILINLYEDHLDHYGDFATYVAAKQHLFAHQTAGDLILLPREHRSRVKTPARTLLLGPTDDTQADVYPTTSGVCIPEEMLPLSTDDTCLLGQHNRYNIAAVYALCRQEFGLSPAEFRTALRSFSGLPHRLSCVGTFGGVTYYDDSISTVCETTINALTALKRVDTLLLGGLDRGIDYTPLADFLNTHAPSFGLTAIILLPNTTCRLKRLLDAHTFQLYVASDLTEAVALAKEITPTAGVCLLSPAAASYNQFKNFEERGKRFASLVATD